MTDVVPSVGKAEACNNKAKCIESAAEFKGAKQECKTGGEVCRHSSINQQTLKGVFNFHRSPPSEQQSENVVFQL